MLSESRYTYDCKIVRVVDGDTVRVDIDLGFGTWILNESVRLYGIDAPESRTKNLDEKKRGLQSKARLKVLLPEGGQFVIKTKKDKGKYGRTLGIIYDGTLMSVNDRLIEENLAVAYYGGKK